MYENCTTVMSNLELVHLYDDHDLSFLENIRDVHGYVLVVVCLANRLPLTSLRVIRGLVQYELPPRSSNPKTLEEEDGVGFSLYVAGNINTVPEPDGTMQGLRALELPALRGTCILQV